MRKIIVAILLFAMFVFIGNQIMLSRTSVDLTNASKPAPEIVLTNMINAQSVEFESLKGKITLLEFWATW